MTGFSQHWLCSVQYVLQDAVHEQQRNAAQILLGLTGGSADGGGSAPGNTGQPRSAPAPKPSSLPTIERTSSSLDQGNETTGNGMTLVTSCSATHVSGLAQIGFM